MSRSRIGRASMSGDHSKDRIGLVLVAYSFFEATQLSIRQLT